MFLQKREDLLPAIYGLRLAISRGVVVKESVPGAVIAMELVGLAMFLQLRFVLIDLFGGWVGIVISEDAQERTGKIPGVIERRNGEFVIQLIRRHHHPSAPAIDD